jgi:hypothetical protein
MLASITVGAWSAVKILAEDLWISAVNARPASLGVNVFRPDNYIDFATLRQFGYEVKQRLGDLARKQDPGAFHSLANIRDAYAAAFRAPAGEIEARPPQELADLFTKYDRPLHILELLSDLLTHRGGTVDARFLASIKPFDLAEFTNLKPEQLLSLNGETVARLAGPAIEFGVQLIGFVDRWVQQNKA